MKTVTSKDGTTIAYEQSGKGPALILVDGAFQHRAIDPETTRLVDLLNPQFTVYRYDRRGRGDSTDTLPYAVARETEDIEALIDLAGGSAFVYGVSSGAGLALEAALALGSKVKKLAMYEPPYNDDPEARQAWKTFREQIKGAVAEDRRGDAVGLFMMLLGMPAEQLEEMHQYPMWADWEAVAPTLAYEGAVLGEEAAVPTDKAARITVPSLVMNGDNTFPFMEGAAVAIANAMPNGKHRILEGQTHEVAPEAIAPVLAEFFTSEVPVK